MRDEEQVLALEKTWGTAPIEGDLETVASIVSDDWFGIAPTGETMSKSNLLAMLASRPNLFKMAVYDDIKVKIFGETAVVTSRFHGVGEKLDLNQRYMRVYVKRDGKWKCVATQIVPVAV